MVQLGWKAHICTRLDGRVIWSGYRRRYCSTNPLKIRVSSAKSGFVSNWRMKSSMASSVRSSTMPATMLRCLAITSSCDRGLRGSPFACCTEADSLRPSSKVMSTRAGHAVGYCTSSVGSTRHVVKSMSRRISGASKFWRVKSTNDTRLAVSASATLKGALHCASIITFGLRKSPWPSRICRDDGTGRRRL